MIGVEIPGVARIQAHLIAVGVRIVEATGDRHSVDIGRIVDIQVGHTVVVEVDQPAPLVADSAVDRQLIETVGRLTGAGGEVARKDLVAGEGQHVGDVAVDIVGIIGIEDEIPIRVDPDTSGGPDADLRATVDGETGREVFTRFPVAGGELRDLLRLDGVGFAVQGVARIVLDAVRHGEREAIVGQRLEEVQTDGRTSEAARHRLVEELDRRDRNDAVRIADQLVVAGGRGQDFVDGRVDEITAAVSVHAGRLIDEVDVQAVDQWCGSILGGLGIKQIVFLVSDNQHVVDLWSAGVDEDVEDLVLIAEPVVDRINVARHVLGGHQHFAQTIQGEEVRVVQIVDERGPPLPIGEGQIAVLGHGHREAVLGGVTNVAVGGRVDIEPHNRVGFGPADEPGGRVAGDPVDERVRLVLDAGVGGRRVDVDDAHRRGHGVDRDL